MFIESILKDYKIAIIANIVKQVFKWIYFLCSIR